MCVDSGGMLSSIIAIDTGGAPALVFLSSHWEEIAMDQKISFVVDGKNATVTADPAMPLLYALHSELGLNKPKFGCGKAQCGYCLSGWIMTAAAVLKSNPKPTDAEVRQAMAGIKCRCGTHMAILRAIKRAATATA